MNESPITEADYLDLARLVRRVRKASMERGAIPVHSGSAPSAERKKNRAERRRLSIAIKEAQAEIVAWSMSVVPVSESEITREFTSESEEDTEGEDQWTCEGCGALWDLDVDSCDGSWVSDDDSPTHEVMHRPERITTEAL